MTIEQEKRLQKLIMTLRKSDKIHLHRAAQLLGVSEMTIRRDLRGTESTLLLLGGYIVFDPKYHNKDQYIFEEQKFKFVDEKRHIGRLAVPLINENEVIFFDSGTTIPFIIEEIPEAYYFTGICYSLNTFLALQRKPNCTIILCGGKLITRPAIFTTLSGHNELDFIHPNKAFISAAGLSLTEGVTTFILEEIPLKIRAMSVSLHNILVVDHHKFDQIRPGRFGSLSSFRQLITDRQPEIKYQHFFEQQNIEVIY